MINRWIAALVLVICAAPALAAEPDNPAVSIRVDVGKPLGDLRPIWRFFGYDEPNYTYMKDGQKLIGELAQLGHETVYIRCHNLLTSGDGTPALKWGSTNAYSEDASGNPVYDWTIADRIFDTYLARGAKPYVQIGFMPRALSSHPEPYQHQWIPGGKNPLSTGWAYPPKDYQKWGELSRQWVLHCVEKYGKAEVEKWYWEVWNEPNIMYWKGTPEEYFKLYDYAADGVKRALPTARVGGSEIAGGGSVGGIKFQRAFFEHCLHGTNYATGKIGSPLDFVSFHAKGNPRVIEGHVRMGLANQLNDVDKGFEVIASYPELKNKPIVIGESDPDGCAACPATLYPQNGYRNGTLYASYTAASFAREHDLADRHGVNFDGALTWAFEFENQPYFAGFRVLATNGIDLPVLNVFRMYGMMGGKRLAVESDGATPIGTLLRKGVTASPDVSALASLDGRKLCVMVWHYHDDDLPAPPAEVQLLLRNLPEGATSLKVQHYRIDDEHSNPFAAWRRMGAPPSPNPQQYTELERAGKLQADGAVKEIAAEKSAAKMTVTLQRQSVALLVFEW